MLRKPVRVPMSADVYTRRVEGISEQDSHDPNARASTNKLTALSFATNGEIGKTSRHKAPHEETILRPACERGWCADGLPPFSSCPPRRHAAAALHTVPHVHAHLTKAGSPAMRNNCEPLAAAVSPSTRVYMDLDGSPRWASRGRPSSRVDLSAPKSSAGPNRECGESENAM
ncbi:hypothetical protein CHU98_g5213 [Xylaria longipes]|nr:hypothetical protein CHU98_g5213 [Xylaria longipes]